MKKYYFLIVGFLFFGVASSQIVNIPDANFKTKLLLANPSNDTAINLAGMKIKIDANSDGEIQESEAALVWQLNLRESNISLLTGIDSFISLSVLDCSKNNINNTFNINFFPNLTILDCSFNQIQTLNTSNLQGLYALVCHNNLISTIDTSNLTQLREFFFNNNLIQAINVTNLIYLERFDISNNQISDLNVTSCINLEYLYLSNNLISDIDLTSLIKLIDLKVSNNLISSIDVSTLVDLAIFDCSNNLLTSLTTNLSQLIKLDCSENQLSALNINSSTYLKTLNCALNQLTTLNISALFYLEELDYSSNQISNLDISIFKRLKSLVCASNNISVLNLFDLKAIQELNCSNNQIIQLDVSNLAFLISLNCSNNLMTSLDTRASPFLTNLKCNNNFITQISTNSKYSLFTGVSNFAGNDYTTFCCNSIDLTNVQNLVSINCIVSTNCGLPSLPIDSVFKQILLAPLTTINEFNRVDLSGDGEIQQFEANQASILDISFVQVSSPLISLQGIEYFTSLTELRCVRHQITSIDLNSLVNLEKLDCGSNQISALDFSNNSSLKVLKIGGNNFTSFPVGNVANLEEFDFGFNLFSGNVNLTDFTNLKKMTCRDNQITSLDFGLINLNELDCFNNLITTLDLAYMTNLKDLNCRSNLLTSLNISTNSALNNLSCTNNLLTNLLISNNLAISFLDCSFNQLTSLDVSQHNLQEFYFSNNQISTIDLNNSTNLNQLNCNNNLLTSLNTTNNLGLSNLNCSFNQLTTLNLNNNPLLSLDCSNNQLIDLFIKNGMEALINFENNPNLQYICIDENLIEQIQQALDVYGYTNCNVNSYCSFTPGGTFYAINGKNRYDSNSNGCDNTDVGLPNFKLSITNSSLTTGNAIPDLTGNYSLPLQEGTYTLTPIIENAAYFTVSPTSATITLPETVNPYIQDFCVTAIGIHDDLEVAVFPIDVARPGFDASYKIMYKNKGTATQSGNLSFVFDDAVLNLVTAFPAITNQTINNLSWDFTNLLPFESREIIVTLNVNSPMETPAVNNNDILGYSTTISGLTDETPLDNLVNLYQTVVNSFDPNDKECLEGNYITPSMIGKYVHYKIRFENTGTFPVQNIVVTDRIDTSIFDISTLLPVNGSHAFTTRITDKNKVEFIFQNIFLPFDDATNDGYIVFKIKTWPTLSLGDELKNTANIFFDYNFPIETNTATTVVANPLASQDFDFGTYFKIFPNPAKNILNINSKQNIQIETITIYTTIGQLVQVIPNAKNTKTIDVSNLKSGTYFIKVVSDKGASSSKFVKE